PAVAARTRPVIEEMFGPGLTDGRWRDLAAFIPLAFEFYERLQREFTAPASPAAPVLYLPITHRVPEDLARHNGDLEAGWQASRGANRPFVLVLDWGGPAINPDALRPGVVAPGGSAP